MTSGSAQITEVSLRGKCKYWHNQIYTRVGAGTGLITDQGRHELPSAKEVTSKTLDLFHKLYKMTKLVWGRIFQMIDLKVK